MLPYLASSCKSDSQCGEDEMCCTTEKGYKCNKECQKKVANGFKFQKKSTIFKTYLYP